MEFDDRLLVDASSWLQRSPRLLVGTICTLVIGVLIADWLLPKDTAIGVLYAIPILFSLWRNRRRSLLAVGSLCIVLLALPLANVREADHASMPAVLIGRIGTALSLGVITAIGLMRLRAERELRRLRKVAVTTLRSLGDAVLTISEEGRVHFVNVAAEVLLGRSRSSLLGRDLAQVFVTRAVDTPRPPVVELAEKGLPDWREAVLSTRDGRSVPIEYARTLIESADGEQFGEVLVFRDITARKEHEDAMKRLAYRDELTGLPNRTSLLDRFQLELAHARRNRESLGVLYLDLDGFKLVNDRHGHAAGDALLIEVAQRMRSALRAGDTVARIGGDEFVVLLPTISGEPDALRVAEKLRAALEPAVEFRDLELHTSASIGIALFPRDGGEPDALLQRADAAMYRAKHGGAS